MAGLSIEIEGLQEIRNSLDKKTLDQKLVPAIGLAVLGLHNAIKTAVARTYSLNKSLDTVLLGKANSQLKQGLNFISYDINYIDVPVRLSEFPNEVSKITIPTIKFLARLPDGGFGVITKSWAEVTKVKVIRSKGYQTVVGQKGYGGWKANIKGRVDIYERRQDATWRIQAVERAPYRPLYGPSLAQMATTMFDKDTSVQTAKDRLTDQIADFINL